MSVCRGCPQRRVGCRRNCEVWQEEQLAKKLRYEVKRAQAESGRTYLPEKVWQRKAWTRPEALRGYKPENEAAQGFVRINADET